MVCQNPRKVSKLIGELFFLQIKARLNPNTPPKELLSTLRQDDEHPVTMGREEQIEEREVLDSIFPEEING